MRYCNCGADSQVVDSRPLPDGVRRTRQCSACGKRWYTVEIERGLYRRMTALRQAVEGFAIPSGDVQK